MGAEGDRRRRAGDYILGLMGEKDRERAERDLEIDPAFRDAVMELAERMHVFDHADMPQADAEGRWKLVAERIGELPQMRPASVDGKVMGKPVIEGPGRSRGIGLHALPGRRSVIIAAGLIAAFVLGYVVGRL